MASLVQYLISFFLGEGLQLQRRVSEKRHGQMKVVIPQLRGKQGFQILIPQLTDFAFVFNKECNLYRGGGGRDKPAVQNAPGPGKAC